MRWRNPWILLCLVGAANLLSCSADEAAVVPSKERPQISNLAILSIANRELRAGEQENIWNALAQGFHQKFGVRVLAGRSLGKAVWQKLDNTTGDNCEALAGSIQEAKRAYQQLQVVRSLQLLTQAHGQMLLCEGEKIDHSLLTDRFVYAGMALLSQNQISRAEAEFRQAVSLDTGLSLQGKEFRPDQVTVFERAKRQLLSGNPTSVEVRSWPAGANIVVDGRVVGVTPSKEVKLYPGPHFIRLELAGHALWTQMVLDGLPPSAINALMVPLFTGPVPEELYAQAAAGRGLTPEAEKELKQVADFYQVEAIVLASLIKADNQLRLVTRFFLVLPNAVTEAQAVEMNLKAGTYEPEINRRILAFRDLFPKKANKPPKKK